MNRTTMRTKSSDNKRYSRDNSLAIGGVVIVLVAGVLLFLTRQANRAARETNCRGNVATIAALLRSYRDLHGRYPPLTVEDENGNRMHSWRLLLARMELPDEYAGYDMEEPWDGPNNRKYISQIPRFFKCANDSHTSANRFATSYVGINIGSWGMSEQRDDSQTVPCCHLLVVEMAESSIPWTKPDDLDTARMSMKLNDFSQRSIRSHDPLGPVVLNSQLVYERLDVRQVYASIKTIEELVTLPFAEDGEQPRALIGHPRN